MIDNHVAWLLGYDHHSCLEILQGHVRTQWRNMLRKLITDDLLQRWRALTKRGHKIPPITIKRSAECNIVGQTLHAYIDCWIGEKQKPAAQQFIPSNILPRSSYVLSIIYHSTNWHCLNCYQWKFINCVNAIHEYSWGQYQDSSCVASGIHS